MTAWQQLLSGWNWEPSVVVGCLALLLVYIFVEPRRLSARPLPFLAGTAALLLALNSPLEALVDSRLFSAHTVQHVLLILVAPPLLLMGISRGLAQGILRYSWVRAVERYLGNPRIAWPVGVAALWIWHWPRLYNFALANQPVHAAEHLTLLATAVMFWWPVIGPIEELRLTPVYSILYVSGACIAQTALAILLTVAPLGFYPTYLQPHDTMNLFPFLRDHWGLTPQSDRVWGGLLMWAPACAVYLCFVVASLARWYRIPDRRTTPATRQSPGREAFRK